MEIFVSEQQRKFTDWVEKERQESEKAMEDKATMIRQLTQEVYKVVRENQQLKKELQITLKEIQKERKANEMFLNKKTQKEKEAFVCFTAALEAKNLALEKLGMKLKNKEEELHQLKEATDALKIKFETSMDILEEKRRTEVEQKENEIQNLIVRMSSLNEVNRRSSSPCPPKITLATTFERKRRTAQKQVQDICELMQSQTENHVRFVEQIESTFLTMNESNRKLKQEVEDLKAELEKKDQAIRSLQCNQPSIQRMDSTERELLETKARVDRSLRDYLDFSWADDEVDGSVENLCAQNTTMNNLSTHNASSQCGGETDPVPFLDEKGSNGMPLSSRSPLDSVTDFESVIENVVSYLKVKIKLMEKDNWKIRMKTRPSDGDGDKKNVVGHLGIPKKDNWKRWSDGCLNDSGIGDDSEMCA